MIKSWYCFLLTFIEFINSLWCLLVLSSSISSVHGDIHSSLQLNSVVGYDLQHNHFQLEAVHHLPLVTEVELTATGVFMSHQSLHVTSSLSCPSNNLAIFHRRVTFSGSNTIFRCCRLLSCFTGEVVCACSNPESNAAKDIFHLLMFGC